MIQTDNLRKITTQHINTVALFVEVVNAATELIIEHREVKSEVMFLGYLPSDAV